MSLVAVQEAPVRVAEAIQRASRATGADFDYLLQTAARESNFNQGAKARTSSAAGLFQFIENTWLETMKAAGDQFGLGKYADNIFKTSTGRHYVPNPQMRNEILKLRHDPEISAVLAGAFTQQNAEIIAERIGREPTQGELYIGHFLGASGGANFIDLAESRPSDRADRHFPKAARANRSIFYSKGSPRSMSEVYRVLVAKHDANKVASSQMAELPQRNPIIASELESVNPEDTKVAPLPMRKLALGAPGSGESGMGSVGQWVTIVQEAQPVAPSIASRAATRAAPEAIAPVPRVAGWRQTIDRVEPDVAAKPLGRRAAAGVERSEPDAGRIRPRAGGLRLTEPQQPLRHAQRAAHEMRSRTDDHFENFFHNLTLSG